MSSAGGSGKLLGEAGQPGRVLLGEELLEEGVHPALEVGDRRLDVLRRGARRSSACASTSPSRRRRRPAIRCVGLLADAGHLGLRPVADLADLGVGLEAELRGLVHGHGVERFDSGLGFFREAGRGFLAGRARGIAHRPDQAGDEGVVVAFLGTARGGCRRDDLGRLPWPRPWAAASVGRPGLSSGIGHRGRVLHLGRLRGCGGFLGPSVCGRRVVRGGPCPRQRAGPRRTSVHRGAPRRPTGAGSRCAARWWSSVRSFRHGPAAGRLSGVIGMVVREVRPMQSARRTLPAGRRYQPEPRDTLRQRPRYDRRVTHPASHGKRLPYPGDAHASAGGMAPNAAFDGRPGLLDRRGRALRDLRISVTDRCNFRCTYCMPAEVFGRDYAFLPHSEVLTYEEIRRLAGIAVDLGVAEAPDHRRRAARPPRAARPHRDARRAAHARRGAGGPRRSRPTARRSGPSPGPWPTRAWGGSRCRSIRWTTRRSGG